MTTPDGEEAAEPGCQREFENKDFCSADRRVVPTFSLYQALALYSLQFLLDLPQLILLPLDVGLDHPGPLLQLLFQVLHGLQLAGELHHRL
ncbi:hypothetical protein INR49_008537 [Caranx melampygus]|nr:hypothetical protein INR49_008537 [Caranx melampygus]